MTPWALVHFFSFIVNFFLSAYIVWKNPRRILNWFCAATVFLFSLWSFGTTCMRNPLLPESSIKVFNNVAAIGWIGFSAFFLLFSLQFRDNAIGRKGKKTRLVWNLAIITLPAVFIFFQWNGLFMREYRLERYGWVGVWPSSAITYLFYALYGGFIISGLIVIYRARKRSVRTLIKKQAGVLIVSVVISMLLGSVASILLRHAGIYAVPPLGDVFTVLFAAGLFYATARYRLFEFNPATAANKILETMTDGVLLINTQGTIVECNQAISLMLGYGREELIGMPFTAIIPDSIYHSTYVKELLRRHALANVKGFLQTKSGSEVPVLASAGLIKDENEIAGFVMVVRDYTELQNAELRMVRLLETAKSIIDWLPFGVVTVDKNGRIKNANKYARDVLAISGDAIIGMDCRNLLCFHGGVNCPLRMGVHERKNVEIEITAADGRNVPILKSVMQVNLDGEESMLETFIDITELKKARDELVFARDAAEAANRAKSAFLANMSHEIRTPLNAILGFAQLLQSEETEASKKEKLSIILQSGENLLRILNDILDFSRIEAGKIDLFETDFSLKELCDEIASMFRIRAENKGIVFALRQSIDPLPRVKGDKQRIMQIVANLVDNAIKFTELGSVLLEYGYEKGNAIFRIIDTGIGIPPEKKMAIFQPFDQVDPTITRRYGGSGLGLAIVRQLVEMMRGMVECESDVGKGTVFTVRLPLLESPMLQDSMHENQTQVAVEPAQKPSRPLKVLLVEDNDLNRNLLCRLLEMLEMEYDTAANGREALDKLSLSKNKNKLFDVVLLDIQMPVMDGLECIGEIRANQSYSGIFVVALTAHALLGDAERLTNAGFDDYMPKPIDINDFFEKMKSIAKRILDIRK